MASDLSLVHRYDCILFGLEELVRFRLANHDEGLDLEQTNAQLSRKLKQTETPTIFTGPPNAGKEH
jgi:hypothetical protein